MAMRGSRDSQGKLGDAAREHTLEWCDALAGPLPDQDKLFARILNALVYPARLQRASSDYSDGVAFLEEDGAYCRDTRAAHWHACANAHAPDTVDHAHLLRLLQQKADFIDFKAAESASSFRFASLLLITTSWQTTTGGSLVLTCSASA